MNLLLWLIIAAVLVIFLIALFKTLGVVLFLKVHEDEIEEIESQTKEEEEE